MICSLRACSAPSHYNNALPFVQTSRSAWAVPVSKSNSEQMQICLSSFAGGSTACSSQACWAASASATGSSLPRRPMPWTTAALAALAAALLQWSEVAGISLQHTLEVSWCVFTQTGRAHPMGSDQKQSDGPDISTQACKPPVNQHADPQSALHRLMCRCRGSWRLWQLWRRLCRDHLKPPANSYWHFITQMALRHAAEPLALWLR